MKKTSNQLFGRAGDDSIWAWQQATGSSGEAPGSLKASPNQILFLFTLSGGVSLRLSGGDTRNLGTGELAVCSTGGTGTVVKAGKSGTHFLVVGMKRDLLGSMLEDFRPGLDSEIRSLVFNPRRGGIATFPIDGTVRDRLLPAFRSPLVAGTARSFWFESQIKEMIALLCFRKADQEGEFFCSRQKRLTQQRVERAKAWLKTHYEEGLDLRRLAADVGCSPFYLSRTFSAETGTTISQYVRRLRVEKAAELLLSGGFTVSEAAVEVGYQSLSHFSKAFQQVKGCLPSKYDAA